MVFIYYFLILLLILVIGILYVVYYRIVKNKDWSFVTTKSWLLNRTKYITKNKHRKVCVISGDNRVSEDIISLRNINQKYCDTNGYDFKFYNNDDIIKPVENGTSLYLSHPPYWWKVKMVYDTMMNSDYDYLMWIDSDACFHDHNIRIENLFKNKISKRSQENNFIFIMSSDNPRFKSQFNAGVWMVKNNKKGRNFMKKWLDLYDKNKWYRKEDHWICKYYFLPCAWSGIYYEQGSGYHLMHDSKFSPYILQLDHKILQGHKTPNKYSFTIHFAGDDKKYIKSYTCKYFNQKQ